MTDVAYYQRRLAEELAAAEASSSPEAAEAHREMAERYRLLLARESAIVRMVDRKAEPETPVP